MEAAMTVAIRFPDGSIRDVPGQLVAKPGKTDRTPVFVQIPVNCDPLWRYRQVGDAWFAFSRHANLSVLRPAGREWWQSIKQMDDRPADCTSNVA